jgi:hypothetical protein
MVHPHPARYHSRSLKVEGDFTRLLHNILRYLYYEFLPAILLVIPEWQPEPCTNIALIFPSCATCHPEVQQGVRDIWALVQSMNRRTNVAVPPDMPLKSGEQHRRSMRHIMVRRVRTLNGMALTSNESDARWAETKSTFAWYRGKKLSANSCWAPGLSSVLGSYSQFENMFDLAARLTWFFSINHYGYASASSAARRFVAWSTRVANCFRFSTLL